MPINVTKVGIKCIWLITTLFCVLSCKNDLNTSDPDKEIRERYFNLENVGWKSKAYEQTAGDISFTATEVPIQYYMLKDLGNSDLRTIDSLYEENKTERVLEFTFRQNEEKDLLGKEFTGMDYEQSVKYMAFGLERDFYAVTSKKDTIACSGVVFERNYKIAPFQKVMLFFSGISPDDRIQLVYDDHLFKKGTLKFQFKETYTEIAL